MSDVTDEQRANGRLACAAELIGRRRLWLAAGLTIALGSFPVAALADQQAPLSTPVAAAEQPQQVTLPKGLERVEEIDAKIKKMGSVAEVARKLQTGSTANAGAALTQEEEMLFLRRSLIYDAGYTKVGTDNRASWIAPKHEDDGYNALVKFVQKGADNAKFLEWLLNDYEALQLYVTGGIPGGRSWWQDGASHVRSIEQFMALAKAHPDDITRGKTSEADRVVYKKMMVSAALGMNDRTRLWTGTTKPADPVVRYEIIKKFREHSDQYRFRKDIFDQLPVENMRWIFENRIANEEMPWLANYSLGRYPNAKDEGSRLNAYSYIEYGHHGDDYGGYKDPEFYNEDNLYKSAVSQEPQTLGQVIQGGWNAKYHFTYEDDNFPNQNPSDPYYLELSHDHTSDMVRLWMPFEEGGVCGAVSKTGENINGIIGVPAAVGGQPGHAAFSVYSLVDDTTTPEEGDKAPRYGIGNDSGAGWLRLGGTEMNHLPCEWRQVHEEVKGPDGATTKLSTRWGDGTFILMAQDALNNMDAYTKASELLQLAAACDTVEDKLAAINAALEVQPANWDALLAKTELYEKKKATSDEWYAFAQALADACVEYPYPMQSFLVRIEQRAGDPKLVFKLEDLRIKTLERAKQVTKEQSVQHDAIRDTAERLLGRFSQQMFTFSFDGPDAGKIKLGPQLSVNVVPWKYSLDGGSSWNELISGEKEVQLTQQQLESITSEHDIKIQVIGMQDIYSIDIVSAGAPAGYFANNGDNRVYARTGQAVTDLDVKQGEEWVQLTPDMTFAGEQTIEVRRRSYGTTVKSDKTTELQFSEKWDIPGTSMVPLDQLSISDSFQTYSGEPKLVIDGYVGTEEATEDYWHSQANENGPWITIDLGTNRNLNHVDMWVRKHRPANGVPYKVEILTAPDGSADANGRVPDTAFTSQGIYTDFNWPYPNGMPDQMRHLTLDKPVSTRYVRVKCIDGYGNFFVLNELAFFEKVGEKPEPEPPVDPEPTPDPKPDPDPQPPVDPDPKPPIEPEPNPPVDPEPQPPVEPEPKPPVDPDPQPPVDPQPQPDPSPEPEPDPSPDPQPNPDPNPEPNPAPDPDQKPGAGQQGGAGDNQGKPEKPGNPGVSGSTLPQTGDTSFIAPILASVATAITAVGVRMRRK